MDRAEAKKKLNEKLERIYAASLKVKEATDELARAEASWNRLFDKIYLTKKPK